MSEVTISGFFDEVFFDAPTGGVIADVPYPYEIALDGHGFTIDLNAYQWSIPNALRSAYDFSARPGEQSYDTAGVWKRIAGDWSLGQGQVYADTERASARQFRTSLGVDPWTERELSLLPDTTVAISTTTETNVVVFPCGTSLYTMFGAAGTLRRSANPEAVSPTLTSITGGGTAPWADVTCDGKNVYVAAANKIYKHASSGTTFSAMSGAAGSYVASLIEYANGWLLVAAANVLSSVAADGTITGVYTHPNTDFVWSAVVGTPQGIFAAGNVGDRATIYYIGLDPTTGGLAVPLHAGHLEAPETIGALSEYAGDLLIGTSDGLRFGQTGGGGSLAIGPLMAAGDCRCMVAERQFVWFGWKNYDATHTGLGRARLNEFVPRTATPCYATDLMYAGQGAVTSVCRFGGRTYFGVAAAGVVRAHPSGNLVATATLTLGRLEFGTAEPKAFIGAEIVTAPLDGVVGLNVTDDAGVNTPLGTFSDTHTTNLGVLLRGTSALSTYFEVNATLARATDATKGPTIRLITLRGLPVPRQVQRWVLPIICKERVLLGADRGTEQSQDVATIRAFFTELRRSGRPITYIEGTATHRVIVRELAFPAQSVERWGINRDGMQGTLMVTIDSIEG